MKADASKISYSFGHTLWPFLKLVRLGSHSGLDSSGFGTSLHWYGSRGLTAILNDTVTLAQVWVELPQST